MTKKNKVFTHPEREQIIEKLLNGESVKKVEAWLKKRHPRKKRLQISYATLQKFRANHLGLDGKVLDDIKARRKVGDDESEALDAQAILSNSSAYQKKINEIVSNKLDADRKILEMLALVSSRIEYYFNTLSSNGGNLKEDKMLMELINTQKGLVQDWKKYVDGVADKTIEHNININVVNEQVNVLKNIVFDVIQELDPSLVGVFIERVNQKLLTTHYESSEYMEYQSIDVIDADMKSI